MANSSGKFSLKSLFSRDLFTVAIFISILVIIIVPLPKVVLDFFLTLSLTFALLILFISLYIQKPSDLTTFPTLILILALLRLSLNIATTRSILSEGHNGPDYVSSIISAFGDFVVGGNLVIGIIVFIILVLINFIVITKGATRVSEVQARFTLDSLPGKQMAIDADLNAGFITDEQARQRREEVIGEANFYGAMDGSSKFVKGDAIAGIIITIVNLIGGLLIGIFQHDLDTAQSAEIYTILTIGDGLVSQIPSLILSTATAIIITRSSRDADKFATHSVNQLVQEHKALALVGIGLFLFGFVPGFPTATMSVLGALFVGLGYVLYMIESKKDNAITQFFKNKSEQVPSNLTSTPTAKTELTPEEKAQIETRNIEDIMKMEILELKLGYQLLSLVQGETELLDKIKGIRKVIASEFGFVIPQIKIKDDVNLEPKEYSFLLKRISIAKGTVETNKLLAMGGYSFDNLNGTAIKEPVFNLDAMWIDKSKKEDAIINGCTVVDAPTIISTHISELIKKYAEDIITRQDILEIVEKLKADFPTVVDEVMKVTSYGVILKVCKSLLHERVPITDMLTILEAIADIAEYTKNHELIVEHVRAKLFRMVTQKFMGSDGILHVITLRPESEQLLLSKLQEQNSITQLVLSIKEINSLVEKTSGLVNSIKSRNIDNVVMIVDPTLRKRVSEVYEKFGIDLPVLSHAELDSKANFTIEGSLEL
jgi:flagellar biosynthesis protein FlhA